MKKKAENNSFCSAPFSQLVLKPDGNVSPCCYLYHVKLGNLKEKSLLDIWNDKPIQKMRSEFLSSTPKQCKSKIKYLGCNRFFEELDASVERRFKQTAPPRKLDLRLNGQCNLSCIMCDVWKAPNATYNQTSFWEQGPKEVFPFLKEIEVLGGEPFIQKDTYKLIHAVNTSNKNCRWSFVTNAHYNFTKKLEKTLNQLNLKQIQISLDSLKPCTYQHIRKGGDLMQTLKTIQDFVKFRKNYQETFGNDFTFIISMCVLKSNRHEVPEFLDFCQQIEAQAQFQHAFYDPSQQESLSLLNKEAKNEYLTFLKENVKQEFWPSLSAVTKPLQDELQNKKYANS
ncbi:MAG: SPASM domain-containing protein [Oligoflexales bacterium]